MVPGTLLLPVGLLINGWSAQNHVHWIVPDIVSRLSCFFPHLAHATLFRALHSSEPASSSISSPFRCTSSIRSVCTPRQESSESSSTFLPSHAFVFTALAAVTFLRSIAGFAFPLFAPQMYKVLGFGKGDTILAAVAIVIGCPA